MKAGFSPGHFLLITTGQIAGIIPGIQILLQARRLMSWDEQNKDLLEFYKSLINNCLYQEQE
jgi:hypothetical protein